MILRPYRNLTLGLGVALAASSGDAYGQSVQERMQRLSPIVGTWNTEDVYRPDSVTPAVERGVRRCAPALANRYVECITMGRNASGREREYRFYITWDPARSAYTFLSFWSNVAGNQLTTFTVDSTGREWDIRGTSPFVTNGTEVRTWGTLTWVTPDSIVWIGRRNTSTESPLAWPISFRETWSRQR